ncbi:MAG: hypothetical protein ACJAS6_001393 [Rickettsiales bacterium]|jgi:hypothetical protein
MSIYLGTCHILDASRSLQLRLLFIKNFSKFKTSNFNKRKVGFTKSDQREIFSGKNLIKNQRKNV